jgi:hypothetical protein
LVNLFELCDDARTCQRQIYKIFVSVFLLSPAKLSVCSDLRSAYRIPIQEKILFSMSFQTCPEASPAFSAMCAVLFSGVKAAGAWL